jgi:Polyketide cyclase / dehydrase and lipid transport
MKNLKNSIYIVLFICAILFVVSFMLPKQGYVERSITVKADADSVFEQINTIENWSNWADWFNKKDSVDVKYEGVSSGPGATLEWDNSIGIGRVLIIESTKPTSVKYAMRLYKYAPYMGAFEINQHQDSMITIKWSVSLEGGNNPVKKYFSLFLDPILGEGMERSLQRLGNGK